MDTCPATEAVLSSYLTWIVGPSRSWTAICPRQIQIWVAYRGRSARHFLSHRNADPPDYQAVHRVTFGMDLGSVSDKSKQIRSRILKVPNNVRDLVLRILFEVNALMEPSQI
jgi:hypothetical protein